MNSRQIEAWALRVVDAVENGQPNEDFLVELKSTWIDPVKAARRIAGHANAARGESILWLIGLDEKRGVIGVESNDLAEWYAQVEKCFDELAPRLISLNIPIQDKVIVALLFETERSPFVIKNLKGGGSIDREVPWREKTSVRTAHRSDLIRLLAPLEKLPDFELLNIDLQHQIPDPKTIVNYDPQTQQSYNGYGNLVQNAFELSIELYVVPKSSGQITIPFHYCQVILHFQNHKALQASQIALNPAEGTPTLGGLHHTKLFKGIPGSITAQRTAHELLLNGPSRISIDAQVKKPETLELFDEDEIHIDLDLKTTHSLHSVSFRELIQYRKVKKVII